MRNSFIRGHASWRALRHTIAPAIIVISAASLASTAGAQQSAESALINKLVQKGVLSTKDAQELQADLANEASESGAGKISLAQKNTEMKLYGDLRLRYNYQNSDFQAATPNVGTSLPIFTPNTSGDAANGGYYQTAKGTFAPLPSSAFNKSTGAITFPKDAKTGNTTIYKRINTPQVAATGFQQSRERFRLRLDADIKMGENWFAGVELGTSNSADSGNTTLGGTNTAVGDNGGSFNKYSIYISKAYLGWRNEWLTVAGGKFGNPFYTTDLVWDPDINPDGIYESVAFHKLFHAGGAGGPLGPDTSKDGKVVAPPIDAGVPWELTLNMGQFILQDNQEGGAKNASNPSYFDANGNALPTTGAATYSNDSDLKTDAWLFQTQLVSTYKFRNGVSATIAPGWLFENGATVSGANGTVNFNDSTLVSGATRNLNILLLPGDVSFKLGGIPVKVYWDFAYNVDGRKREENTYLLANFDGGTFGGVKLTNHQNEDDYAYLAGFQIGENRKAGDLSFLANWRQTGIAAVDPNLNDNDFALGFLNTRGVKTVVSYNFTDFAVGSVTYMWSNNIRKNLVGGEATTDNAIANGNAASVLFVDLSVKF